MTAQIFPPDDELGVLVACDVVLTEPVGRAALLLRSARAFRSGVQLGFEAVLGPSVPDDFDWRPHVRGGAPDGLRVAFAFDGVAALGSVLDSRPEGEPRWVVAGAGGGGRRPAWEAWVTPYPEEDVLRVGLSWGALGVDELWFDLPLPSRADIGERPRVLWPDP